MTDQKKLSQTRTPNLVNPICLALDVDTREQAITWVTQLSPYLGCVKLGPRLVIKYGQDLAEPISKVLPVFIDCKFFDIPSTMCASVQACFDMGASLVTVHAMAGMKALKEVAILETKLKKIRPFMVTVVTVLTSQSEQDSLPIYEAGLSVEEQITRLAKMVQAVGLSSVVCSAHEAHLMRQMGLLPVVPGIRFEESSNPLTNKITQDDQARKASPLYAIEQGAWSLVIGRPILKAQNPIDTIKQVLASISHEGSHS